MIETTKPGVPRQELHSDAMLAVLPWPDRSRPNWQSLVAILGGRGQLLEDFIAAIYHDCTLPIATADALEQWGSIVGEARGGLEDTEYRLVIRAKLRAEGSFGTVEDMISIVLAMSTGAEVYVGEAFPHTTQIYYRARRTLSDEARGRLIKFLRLGKSGGVILDWIAEGDSTGARFDVDTFEDSTFWEVIYNG